MMFFTKNKLSQQKKELYKLIVARSDITAALKACDLFLSKVKDMSTDFDLYIPLLNAIVVCYSRPFSSNKPLGPLSKKWHEFDNIKLKKMHKTILDMRDNTVAHSDLDQRKVFIYPKGAPLFKTGIVAKGLSSSVTNQALPVNIFPIIRETCFDLGRRLNEEAERQLEVIFGNENLEPKEFELTFD